MGFLPEASISQPKTSLNWESLPFVLLTPNRFGYVRNEGDSPHLATDAQLVARGKCGLLFITLRIWSHSQSDLGTRHCHE